MPTFWQLSKKLKRKPKYYKNKRIALRGCPQKLCILKTNIREVTPRKPNSAKRKVAWVSTRRPRHLGGYDQFFAYLMGESKKTMSPDNPNPFQGLQRYSRVLVRGGRTKDTPGLKYKLMHSSNTKLSLKPLVYLRKKRSKYGVKKIRKENELKNLWKFKFKYY